MGTDAATTDDLVSSLAEAIPSAVLVGDLTGRVVVSNSAARTLLADTIDAVARQLTEARAGGSTRMTFELGRHRVHARITDHRDGWLAMLDEVVGDADPDELTRIAHTDQLTGIANRLAFETKLGQVLALAAGETPVSIVILDIDGFKRVNDTYGAAAGDQVLKVAAKRLKSAVRPGDVVARVGGDEFGLICLGLGADDAPMFADRVAEAIKKRMNIGTARVLVGATVATVSSPPAPADASSMLAFADKAMRRDMTIETWMPQIEL
jgi:diguanylate cyclase (GGDEF)-like protein